MTSVDFVIRHWELFLALVVVLGLLLAGPITQFLLGVKKISPAQAILLVNRQDGVVMDVCEAHEFRAGHIPNAVNVPLSGLKARIKDLEKYRNKPIVVSCRSGNRSVKGAMILRRFGFPVVYSLSGGLVAWQRDHLPVEK
jgi:rhodanese-related sulfurtransferase